MVEIPKIDYSSDSNPIELILFLELQLFQGQRPRQTIYPSNHIRHRQNMRLEKSQDGHSTIFMSHHEISIIRFCLSVKPFKSKNREYSVKPFKSKKAKD